MIMTEALLKKAPLGHFTQYKDQYDSSLLFPIPRESKRKELGVVDPLPFYGWDTWYAYEVSWLNPKGKPQVAIGRFDFPADSPNMIESKSLKLYLNSINNTQFSDVFQIQEIIAKDLSLIAGREVQVNLMALDQVDCYQVHQCPGVLLDALDVSSSCYHINTDYLKLESRKRVEETLCSNLLRSNCLVTGQPDWGTVVIDYVGPKISHEGLLKYIISYRNHNEFHEPCVERIFMDIFTQCHPKKLTVEARYTRRGGLDINPIRSTEPLKPQSYQRFARQ